MTFDTVIEFFTGIFSLKTENIGAANLKMKTILCSLDVSCILKLAHWSETKLTNKLAHWSEIKLTNKIVLMLDEILKVSYSSSFLFSFLLEIWYLVVQGTVVGGEGHFPLEKTIFTFDKINGRCACYDAFSVGKK